MNATLEWILRGIARRFDIPHVFFDDVTGRPVKDVKMSLNTASRKAGIKDFHFHDLRHTFAFHLVMAGVEITTVKEILGRKTMTMTLRHAHLAPFQKGKAAGIPDNALNEQPTIKGSKRLKKA